MNKCIGLLIVSCFFFNHLHSQDYIGKWTLNQAKFNNSTITDAKGYFNFQSTEMYDAELSNGSIYGWAEALYTMSGSTLNSRLEGESFALNGMTIVSDANGRVIFTDINCDNTTFDNYLGTAIGYGKPSISVGDGVLTVESADGKAVFKYSKVLSSEFFAATITNQPGIFNVFPNPTSQSIHLAINLEHQAEVVISVYNSIGQKVKILFDGTLIQDADPLTFDVSDLQEGLFFIQLSSKSSTTTQRLIISR